MGGTAWEIPLPAYSFPRIGCKSPREQKLPRRIRRTTALSAVRETYPCLL